MAVQRSKTAENKARVKQTDVTRRSLNRAFFTLLFAEVVDIPPRLPKCAFHTDHTDSQARLFAFPRRQLASWEMLVVWETVTRGI